MGKKKSKKLNNEKETSDKNMQIFEKITESNKLLNEESNRLITWSLSIIGGSILVIISTDYVNPKGCILYAYSLFLIGWFLLSISIHYGESLTRSYIAGITIGEKNVNEILQIGKIVDKKFASQIRFFRYGILPFAIWLFIFLIWFIFKPV